MLLPQDLSVLYGIISKGYTQLFGTRDAQNPDFQLIDPSRYSEFARAVRASPNDIGLAEKIRAVARFFYQYLLGLIRTRVVLQQERGRLLRQSRHRSFETLRRIVAIDDQLSSLAVCVREVAADYMALLCLAQLLAPEAESLLRLQTSEAQQELGRLNFGFSTAEVSQILIQYRIYGSIG